MVVLSRINLARLKLYVLGPLWLAAAKISDSLSLSLRQLGVSFLYIRGQPRVWADF